MWIKINQRVINCSAVDSIEVNGQHLHFYLASNNHSTTKFASPAVADGMFQLITDGLKANKTLLILEEK